MATYSLDEKKAERAGKPAPVVIFGGKEFTMPVELPFKVFREVTKLAGEGGVEAIDALLDIVLGDQKDEFLALDPSLNDVTNLIEFMTTDYNQSVEGDKA